MPTFLTRVELHNGTVEDYNALHANMTRALFFRTIQDLSGKIFNLPTAMYYSHGDLTSTQVREFASEAARATGRQFWVITANYNDAAWLLNEAR